jgi:hypothetical protein
LCKRYARKREGQNRTHMDLIIWLAAKQAAA